MNKTRSFDIPDELAGKLDELARQQGKSTKELLAEIVGDYIEVSEFIVRKANARASRRNRPKVPRT